MAKLQLIWEFCLQFPLKAAELGGITSGTTIQNMKFYFSHCCRQKARRN